ncbi:phage infection protein [Bacillus sp. AFS015802]|uniref:YhgE/Pip domain-containing protein n=1 Tax=Bacillus sp. AFS015802 TaxID=2033486 RepID=UPI000BFA7C02|nr:ABC transporter permease [Bacillus sp. AFS015802]PFA63352.1 phage infection protein [Bacillus sp. AFS015802]
MFKNKLVLASPLIALAIIFIFSLTLFPSVQPQPKNLPIAIVNEDEGVQVPDQPKMNMGETLVEKIQTMSSTNAGEEPAVKWVNVKNAEAVQKGLDNQEYYAALVIPKDFSAKQASLRTPDPIASEVQIYINQGMNTMASTAAGQILNGVVDNMNNAVREQLLDGFEKQKATLTPKQVQNLVTPITKSVTNVNEIGTNSANGNAPVSLFQPLWMASMASAAIIYLAVSKLPVVSRKEKLTAKSLQILIGAVVALVVGFGLTWLADALIGFHIPDVSDTALFLSLTSFSFYLMISAILSLIGIKGMPLFVLMLFFGAPLLAMAPEMMSSFYRDWFYSWLPMKFMVQGLRELFYFGKGLSWNSAVSTLLWIGVGGMLVILATAFKPHTVEKTAVQMENGQGA